MSKATDKKKKKLKLLAIVGPSGAGKDTLANEIYKDYTTNLCKCVTTRPKRNSETNENYNFISDRQFAALFANNELVWHTEHNGWYYGLPLSSLTKNIINICILNPAALKSLENNKDIDIAVIYLDAAPAERLKRCLEREKNPNVNEIIRRFSSDQDDFKNCYEEIIFKKEMIYTDDVNSTPKSFAISWLKRINWIN